MSIIRRKIELWFQGFGDLVYRHHWIAIFIMLALALGPASQLPKITFDLSTEGFLHDDDPALITYNDFRRQYGRDDMMIIAIEPKKVFDQTFLAKLRAFHDDLEEEVPHVDDIISMVNARNTRGEGESLIVEDLLETWPEDEAALEALRRRVLSKALYVNRLISEDGRFTTVVIKTDSYSSLGGDVDVLAGFDEEDTKKEEKGDGSDLERPPFLTDEENRAAVEATRRVMARYEAPDFKLYLAGFPVATDEIKRSMMRDVSRFVRLVVLTICVFLLIMFRRLTGMFLPLLIVAFSLLSTLGLMAMFNVPVKLLTAILPSFLLAVGVGAAVHLLAIFYQNFQKTGDRRAAICHALGHSGLAIAMTSLTTAVGLASFATAEVAPVADLGAFASVGVLFSLVYTIVLLPALLSIIPVKVKQKATEKSQPSFMDQFLRVTADFATSRPKSITALSMILIAVSLIGASRLTFSHHVLGWLPEDSDIRLSTEKIDHELKGTVTLEVLVDTGRENGLYEVETLNKLDGLTGEVEKIRDGDFFVGKATSVADILKEIHQALNENRPDFYGIPQDPKLIPQEFLLFENSGSDDLEDVVDSQFSQARFTIKAPWLDFLKYQPVIPEIEDRFQKAFGDRARTTMTGMMTIGSRTIDAAIHSAARSYIIAGFVITVMMIILVGSLRIGLLSMIPNLLPIIITLGVMGWFDFPFDLFTMLIGSIAIGLAVDDTIHFMHNFRRYYSDTGDVRGSVRQTLHTAGRAMLVTSIVLSLGFFIYMFASMNNLFYFGLLTGMTIIMALLADFFVAPALMVLANPRVRK